jgi:hypothetical protein
MCPVKSFAQFMRNIPGGYVPRIEEALSDAVRVLGDPAATREQYDVVAGKLSLLQHRVGRDTVTALQGEIEERLKARWQEAGRADIDIPQYVKPKINDLLARVERGRAMANPSYWTHSNAMLTLGGAFALVAGVVFLGGVREGETLAGLVQNVMRSAQLSSAMVRARVSADDFGRLTTRLQAPATVSVPTPALPAQVAAVAQQPAAVAIERHDGTVERSTTTFGEVYRALPSRLQDEVKDAIPAAPEPPAPSSRKCTRKIDVKSEVGRFRSSSSFSC